MTMLGTAPPRSVRGAFCVVGYARQSLNNEDACSPESSNPGRRANFNRGRLD